MFEYNKYNIPTFYLINIFNIFNYFIQSKLLSRNILILSIKINVKK